MTMGQKFHNVSVTDGPPAKRIKKWTTLKRNFFLHILKFLPNGDYDGDDNDGVHDEDGGGINVLLQPKALH